MALSTSFETILRHFPQKNLKLVFAYGSGAFQQIGHADKSKNMLDFIIAVDDPQEWHCHNIELNPNHYSYLRHLGPKPISYIQESFGAGIYFNTLVPCEDRVIKYGVLSTITLTNDLLDWDTLYVSGRLHKPVSVLHQAHDHALKIAMATNLQSAVHTALLLLPETFTQEELFTTITGLSYTGDFRMTVGEDKNKVSNIVNAGMDNFIHLYEDILQKQEHLLWNRSNGMCEQSLSPISRIHHLNLLPKMLQNGLVNHRNKDGRYRDAEDVLRSFAHDSECSDALRKSVVNIVKKSSFTQSVKGIITAGFKKSISYSWSKLKKMYKSLG